MYSVMMNIGLFLLHTPYNWTRLLCWSLVITYNKLSSINCIKIDNRVIIKDIKKVLFCYLILRVTLLLRLVEISWPTEANNFHAIKTPSPTIM